MEEENENQSNMRERSNTSSLKDTLKSGTPDEVKDRVKDVVEKGVAAVAGALQGFNRGTEKNHLPEETKGAIHQAAETTKATVSSVTEEVSGLREPLKEAGQKLSQTARDFKSTVREQVDQTRSAVRDTDASSGTKDSTFGSTGSYGSMGMGGSELDTSSTRESSGQGSELPDISKTPLAQPDRKLLGKDLTGEFDDE